MNRSEGPLLFKGAEGFQLLNEQASPGLNGGNPYSEKQKSLFLKDHELALLLAYAVDLKMKPCPSKHQRNNQLPLKRARSKQLFKKKVQRHQLSP
jgi:hypothetical protein